MLDFPLILRSTKSVPKNSALYDAGGNKPSTMKDLTKKRELPSESITPCSVVKLASFTRRPPMWEALDYTTCVQSLHPFLRPVGFPEEERWTWCSGRGVQDVLQCVKLAAWSSRPPVDGRTRVVFPRPVGFPGPREVTLLETRRGLSPFKPVTKNIFLLLLKSNQSKKLNSALTVQWDWGLPSIEKDGFF